MTVKWHTGNPPAVGWYRASLWKRECIYRWWNGRVWSLPVNFRENSVTAAFLADMPQKLYETERIFWAYPPERKHD